jgi:hypothetical protein
MTRFHRAVARTNSVLYIVGKASVAMRRSGAQKIDERTNRRGW